MTLNWRVIWKDAVWSKVIASAIVLLCGLLVNVFPPDWKANFTTWITSEITVPAWGPMLALLILIFFHFFLFRRKSDGNKENLSSSQWFDEIIRQMKDCNFARIYLRNFSHPDQFRHQHRDSLLLFMKSLADRLRAGADIKIIAYHSSVSEKSGLDWLKS